LEKIGSARVGIDDGKEDGTAVGTLVGDRVGKCVGEVEMDGSADGCAVGTNETDGTADGCFEREGDVEGAAETVGCSDTVGDSEGEIVGRFVGWTVGPCVGAGETGVKEDNAVGENVVGTLVGERVVGAFDGLIEGTSEACASTSCTDCSMPPNTRRIRAVDSCNRTLTLMLIRLVRAVFGRAERFCGAHVATACLCMVRGDGDDDVD
jgi:hypothetical protein